MMSLICAILIAMLLSFTVDASEAIPAAVSDLSASPDLNGLKIVDVSFRTPAYSIDGRQLQSIAAISIDRDGVRVKTIIEPRPGKAMIWVDTDVDNGQHIYTVTAMNKDGEGSSASTSCYMGAGAPKAPENVSVRETDDNGNVVITWHAPDSDINGNAIDGKHISYNIINYDETGCPHTVVMGVKTLRYECRLNTGFVNIGIEAVKDGEKSVCSELFGTYIGAGKSMPYKESGALSNNIYMPKTGSGFCWRVAKDDNGIESVDGDNGFFIFEACNDSGKIEPGESNILMLEKINVSKDNAALCFDVFKGKGNNELIIYAVKDGEKIRLENIDVGKLSIDGIWNKVIIPLDKYAGESLVPVIEGVCNDHSSIVIDCIEVVSRPLRDLAIRLSHAPYKAASGCDFKVEALVENRGTQTVSDWSASLSHQGVHEQDKSGLPLSAGQAQFIEFTCRLGVDSPTVNLYSIDIIYDNDNNPENNSSEPHSVTLVLPVFPMVSGLKSTVKDMDVWLEWTAPNPEDTYADPILDDVGKYKSFESERAGDWIMLDRDGRKIGNLSGHDIPELDRDRPYPFFVFDNSHQAFSAEERELLSAHSGSKFFASVYNWDFSPVDDWLISPPLAGCMQTISFWARGLNESFEEKIEVYYSDADTTDPADFYLVGSANAGPKWTCMWFDLPEGACRFALRCISPAGYILMVDDITYRPFGKGESLDILGYNVYRDGVKLTAEPIRENTFIDHDIAEGCYEYAVSTIYDRGESRLSSPITVKVEKSGIDDIESSGKISIYTPSGICIAQDVSTIKEELPNGVYIMITEGRVYKLLVR